MKKTIISLIYIFIAINNLVLHAQGFIHPGALHTQADFDRMKALIAVSDPVIIQAYNNLKNDDVFIYKDYTLVF